MRNAKNLVAEVLDKEGNVVWTSEVTEQVVKNYNNDLASTLGSTRLKKRVGTVKIKTAKLLLTEPTLIVFATLRLAQVQKNNTLILM
ncbi:C5a peptidase domain protein [Streptococcus pyogenes MGAS2111]|nr:C5a peptidase domain protein [Streptococcus pyogenes MGAS2111]